ncbi:MAG: sigma-70 family RNA polymerase sigma factor [Verrucomicrobia bacterium]|nr:sigma-70 family RNA polymerase sigma factor [Verrucomicrobiota bacterium]
MIETEHTLIERLREKPTDADWTRFYRLYEKPILAVAATRSLSDGDCRDVLQETVMKMFRHGFARYDRKRGRFTPFLFGIARDCAIDALRRKAKRNQREVELDSAIFHNLQIDPSQNPMGAAELRGQQVLVATALDYLLLKGSFAPKTVEMFKALVFDEVSPDEVARMFNTSRGNVDQAKSTILKKLRPMYEGLDQGMDMEQALVYATAALKA